MYVFMYVCMYVCAYVRFVIVSLTFAITQIHVSITTNCQSLT
jgi:hypothetical protein